MLVALGVEPRGVLENAPIEAAFVEARSLEAVVSLTMGDGAAVEVGVFVDLGVAILDARGIPDLFISDLLPVRLGGLLTSDLLLLRLAGLFMSLLLPDLPTVSSLVSLPRDGDVKPLGVEPVRKEVNFALLQKVIKHIIHL